MLQALGQADGRPSFMVALGRAGPPPAPLTSALQLQLPTGCLGSAALNVMRYIPEVRDGAVAAAMHLHPSAPLFAFMRTNA